ncbi:protein kinase family protein [Nocardioides alkalitolerans]|uniref:protein kinase family protein n=1 Tax=Nocardioides alkalitolerans TaxID=281714 RepID=UPI0012FB87FA|nr:protein kinase family protein [Nocardioides alkalitolerans]
MPSTIRPGDVLADRYLLIDLLSEAGDGRFWRAHDRVLARHVAVHVIPARTERADELLEAARRCARLTDRRFLRVLDAEVTGDACYVVNEWGTGMSLDLMLQHAPLAPRRAAWMVGEVAGAIAAAHAADITHGRLVPENVIVDLSGSVRVNGCAVDAALKGLPPATARDDVIELVGLLYATLTGRWPGRSPSVMPTAPLDGGAVLRPRQVRAGIPRVLDELCDDVLNTDTPPRAPYDLTTARGIADYLREYVGDPAGMAALEAERGTSASGTIPAVPAALLTPLPVVRPHDTQSDRERPVERTAVRAPITAPLAAPTATPAPTPTPTAETPVAPATPASPPTAPVEKVDAPSSGAEAPASGSTSSGDDAPAPAPRTTTRTDNVDVPTQAGVPIFDDETDDVSWLAKRSETPPPPPDFEDPPERPLFAPETPEEIAARRRAQETVGPAPSEEFWPWATGHRTGAVLPHPVQEPGARRRDKPGRTWLQLAGFLGSLVALLLIVAVVYQLMGRPGTSGGDDDGGSTPSPSASSTESAPPAPAIVPVVGATSIDPEGSDGEENSDRAGNAVDGDTETTWNTSTYFQQFGPGGLKSGVGLQLDLGESLALTGLELDLVGSPTTVQVYVSDEPVGSVDGLEPVGGAEGASEQAQIALTGATGRYVTIWITSLPPVADGFRSEVSEVRVLG